MKNTQVRIGALLSYFLIIINTIYGLFLTPFIISSLGDVEYGVYKIITSLSSSLMVLDLGIGGTVLRFVSKFRADKDEEKIPNFVAMNLLIAALLSFVISAVCMVVYFFLDPMYSNTLTVDQLSSAKTIFIFLSINIVFHVFENVINGIITGYNYFVFGNGLKIVRIILRILIVVLILNLFKSSLFLVILDLLLTIFTFVIELIFVKYKIKIRIKLTKWENSIFNQSAKYTALMFLTSLAAQINNNLDNVVIGSLSGPTYVTVYSIGLTFFSMFENLSTSISGVMLPTVTNALAFDDAEKRVYKIIINAGRVQFILLGAAVVGFAIIGKDFIQLWMGTGYDDAYIIGLILMIPSLFELCINVCLSILRAKNMLEFRTFTLFGTTVLNALITFFTVKYWSYLGAAVGTATSFILGSVIVLNIYYYKRLNLPMMKIYKNIFSKIWICLLISGFVLIVSSKFLSGSWLGFVLNCLIFVIIYSGTLLLFGLTKEEKEQLPFVNKFIKENKNG